MRYLLPRFRPAVAQDRLRLLDDGRVVLTLKTAWADGTRHLVFEPLTLLEKLAALTPRPRINLVLYHAVLAPHSAWRARVVAYGALPVEAPVAVGVSADPNDEPPTAPVCRHWAWADLMRRAFDIDVLACRSSLGSIPGPALPCAAEIPGQVGCPRCSWDCGRCRGPIVREGESGAENECSVNRAFVPPMLALQDQQPHEGPDHPQPGRSVLHRWSPPRAVGRFASPMASAGASSP